MLRMRVFMAGMLEPRAPRDHALRDARCVTVTTLASTLRGVRTLLICLLCLALPAGALAKRAPTKHERAKISRAAHRSHKTDFFKCFELDHVKVSTEGPWAGATLRSCESANDAIFGLFSRRHGRWKLRRMGNGAVGCDIAPKRVQRDLHLGCP
jgi:hypothetical protein